MLRRFGAWKHRSRRVLAVVTVVAGLLILLIAHAEIPGIWTTYWQNQAQPCGTVQASGDWSLGADDAQAATTCFLRAYTQCHAATLVELVSDPITRSWDTYLTEPALLAVGGHSCSIQLNHAIWGSNVASRGRAHPAGVGGRTGRGGPRGPGRWA